MTVSGAVLICLAYVLGLLATVIPGQFFKVSTAGLLVLGTGVAAFFIMPRLWRTGPKSWLWLMAGVVGMLASIYLQFRLPQPAANDISNYIPSATVQTLDAQSLQEAPMILVGRVESMPRRTRSGKAQIWLDVISFTKIISSQDYASKPEPKASVKEDGVKGKVYVTFPLLQATALYPGHVVELTGILYKPQPPANRGAFNFQQYLAKEGSFAGFRARQVTLKEEQPVSKYGLWSLRRHIVRLQVQKLGVPEGPLVSAMTLGKEAVDLPYDVRDWFTQVGLAHAVAASGAQISLILGVVLGLTKRLSEKLQFFIGVLAITIFTGLAGFEPSVCRAALMGLGALLGLLTDRTVKPLGSLLVVATLLLLFNPTWIWDIGFNLSFLATLGLVVTVPGILARLDLLPITIASMIAVPLAAALWTLPLQIYVFHVISPYSILVNILCSPLIAVISLGGFISAFVGVFVPNVGSFLAYLLFYPAHWLIQIAEYFSGLPGNFLAVGTISEIQLVVLYSLIFFVWLLSIREGRKKQLARLNQKNKNKKKNQKRDIFGYVLSLSFILALLVIIIPAWQTKASLAQVTVLATRGQPVLVWQDEGKVTLVNSGDEENVRFNVLPFLQRAGVNQVDFALITDINPKISKGWELLLKSLPVKNIYQIKESSRPQEIGNINKLPVGQSVGLGTMEITVLNSEDLIFLLQIRGKNWLGLGDIKLNQQKKLAETLKIDNVEVLLWSGKPLNSALVASVQPAVAIASSKSLDKETLQYLTIAKSELYSTGGDGAIEWTEKGGFEKTLSDTENKGLF